MTCTVIGFNGKIGKEVRTRDGKRVKAVARTAVALMADPLFTGACAKAAEKLEIDVANLITKRQASKFYRGTGIVYNTIMVKEVVSEG